MRSIYFSNEMRYKLISSIKEDLDQFISKKYDKKKLILDVLEEWESTPLFKALMKDPFILKTKRFKISKNYYGNILLDIGAINSELLDRDISVPTTKDRVDFISDDNKILLRVDGSSYIGPCILVAHSTSPAMSELIKNNDELESLKATVDKFEQELYRYKNTKALLDKYPGLEVKASKIFQHEVERARQKSKRAYQRRKEKKENIAEVKADKLQNIEKHESAKFIANTLLKSQLTS